MHTNHNPLEDLYEQDELLWYEKNAQLLRQHKFDEIDAIHIAESLENMGKQEIGRLRSHLTLLFMHLLKWQFQPERRSRSWELTIAEQRDQAAIMMKDYPSLKGHLSEVVTDAYKTSVIKAARETLLERKQFPEKMPFTLEQALHEDWLPE